MNQDRLITLRGKVVNKFINIELIMNMIISQWYMGKVSEDFVLEVLYDEYFTFALKRRIIEKIFTRRCNSKLKPRLKEMFESLGKLNRIRNVFAHNTANMTLSSTEEEYIPDPKDYDRKLDFQSLYRDFMKKEKEVIRYFHDLFKSIGGKSIREKKGHRIETE